MFYSHSILAKSGPFAHVWLAATWEKKVTRSMIFGTDIATVVESIANPAAPLALRLSANLLVGVVRIYARKARAGVRRGRIRARGARPRPPAGRLPHERLQRGHGKDPHGVPRRRRGPARGERRGVERGHHGACVRVPEIRASDKPLPPRQVANFDELDLDFELDAPLGGGGRPSELTSDPRADEWAAAATTTHRIGHVRDISLADDEEDFAAASLGSRSVAGDDVVGRARRGGPGSDVSSIEIMRGAEDRESNPLSVGGRDSDRFLGRPDDDDAGLLGPRASGSLGAVDDLAALEAMDEDGAAAAEPDDRSGGPMDVDAAPPAAAPRPKRRRPRRAVDLADAAAALDTDTIKGWMRDRSAIVDVKRPRYDAVAAAPADPLAPRLAPAAAPELAAVVARLHGGDGASARAALPVNRRGAEAAPAPAPARFSARFDDDVEVARGGGEGEGEGASLGAAPFAGCDDDGAAPPPFAPPPDEDDDAFAGLAPPPLVDDDDDEDALLAPPPGAASFDAGGVDDLHAVVEPDADEAASGIVPSTDDREWHPNTVKVATLLRDHLADRDALSFGAFTRGADKRSAASAFVELLHLKTWDFVALDQPHAYGDISIAKAACFHDEVPAAA